MTEREMIGTGPWLRFLWKGHITNWLWRDRLKRRITRNLAFGEFKMTYLQKYAEFAKKLSAPPREKTFNKEENNRIFTLWFQGENKAPEIVKKCLNSIKKRYDDRFIILTDESLYDYIELPDFIMEKWKAGKIVSANFSDIVRIELLYQYGGYWFDATDFLTGSIPEFIEDSPFFMYITSDVFFPHMFVQTCFMRGTRKDPLIEMWRTLVHEYWKKEEQACEYFLVHMLLKLLVQNNEEARKLFDEMPKRTMDATHILWLKTGNLPFDQVLYEKMCQESFFQKCSYKRQPKGGVNDIIPGSMADRMINGE